LTRDMADEGDMALNKAWDIYYTNFRRVNKANSLAKAARAHPMQSSSEHYQRQ
jgi:hypothetical protein